MPNDAIEITKARNMAEQALLGAILLSGATGTRQAIQEVATIISPEDFSLDLHQRIYKAMLQCDKPPHEINVAYEMARQNNLQKLDYSFMVETIVNTPCWLDYLDYADKVKAYSLQRQGIKRPIIRGAYAS